MFFNKEKENFRIIQETLIYEERAIFHLKMYTNKMPNSFTIVAKKLLHREKQFFEIGTPNVVDVIL